MSLFIFHASMTVEIDSQVLAFQCIYLAYSGRPFKFSSQDLLRFIIFWHGTRQRTQRCVLAPCFTPEISFFLVCHNSKKELPNGIFTPSHREILAVPCRQWPAILSASRRAEKRSSHFFHLAANSKTFCLSIARMGVSQKQTPSRKRHQAWNFSPVTL